MVAKKDSSKKKAAKKSGIKSDVVEDLDLKEGDEESSTDITEDQETDDENPSILEDSADPASQATEDSVSADEDHMIGFEFEQAVLAFQQIEKHDKFPNCRMNYPGIEELENSIFEMVLVIPL